MSETASRTSGPTHRVTGVTPDVWMEDAPAMVAYLDREARWVAANRSLCARLGAESCDLQGMPWLNWVAETDRDRVASQLLTVVADQQLEGLQFRLIAAGGILIDVEAAIAAVRPARGRPSGWCVFLQDISERMAVGRELESYTHQLERLYLEVEQRTRELEAANEAIRQARLQTLAAEEMARIEQVKTACLDVAAHELRTPVTLLVGILDCLQGHSSSEWGDKLMTSALRSAGRLQNIVEKALKLLQCGQPGFGGTQRSADLAAILSRAADDIRPFVELRRQHLTVECDPAVGTVRCDPSMIRDVAVNLLMNAVKFTPDEGRVELRATADGPDWVSIGVLDTGIGIDLEDLPHIFGELFCGLDTRHHSSGDYEFNKRGPGFGLAIVRKFVELHEGRVDVAARPGGGTVFTVRLPVEGV